MMRKMQALLVAMLVLMTSMVWADSINYKNDFGTTAQVNELLWNYEYNSYPGVPASMKIMPESITGVAYDPLDPTQSGYQPYISSDLDGDGLRNVLVYPAQVERWGSGLRAFSAAPFKVFDNITVSGRAAKGAPYPQFNTTGIVLSKTYKNIYYYNATMGYDYLATNTTGEYTEMRPVSVTGGAGYTGIPRFFSGVAIWNANHAGWDDPKNYLGTGTPNQASGWYASRVSDLQVTADERAPAIGERVLLTNNDFGTVSQQAQWVVSGDSEGPQYTANPAGDLSNDGLASRIQLGGSHLNELSLVLRVDAPDNKAFTNIIATADAWGFTSWVSTAKLYLSKDGVTFDLASNVATPDQPPLVVDSTGNAEWEGVRSVWLKVYLGDGLGMVDAYGNPRLWIENVMLTGELVPYVAKTATPTFNSGQYISAPKAITISCATPGAVIYYTTDESDPTTASPVYGGPVTVGNGTILKAMAQAPGFAASVIATAAFTIPATYNRPATIPYATAVTIDGNLSDWSDATWAPLDRNYDGGGATDVLQAFYAAKWGDNGNKIYVAVKVQDNAFSFTDSYTSWNSRDAIEIYIHTTSVGDTSYSMNADTAQQYAVGIKSSNSTQVWTSLMGKTYVLDPSVFRAAGSTQSGGWIYYEAAITPFEYFGGYSGQPNILSTLQVNDVIGLDVCVVGNNGSYTGMKSENDMVGKAGNWELFGLHKLVGATLIPGDANGDRMVDVGDLGILAANYGGSGKTWAQGDFNGDGLVDVGDLGILAAHYGEGVSAALDFNADYAKAFGTTVAEDDSAKDSSSICSGLGLPLIAGLALMGLMLVKLEE